MKMKQIDKKEMPKLVVLAVLALGVFGFALMQLTGTTTKAATKPPTTTEAAAGTPSAPATTATAAVPTGTPAAQPAVGADGAPADVAMLTSGKDPFVPNGPAAPHDPAAPPVPSAPPTLVAAGPKPDARNMMGLASLQPGGQPKIWGAPLVPAPVTAGGPGGLRGPGPETAANVVPPAPLAPPAYTVTGVVRGDEDIAILRSGAGDGERRFVRPGDPVGNGFKVIAVHADGVEIGSGDRRVTLKLGGDSRAK
jgi:hypothetical protein